MASPAVSAVAESASPTTAATNHTVTLPASNPGDLLVIIGDKGSTAATVNALTGWTELLDENLANGLYVAYRQADGTEPGTITLVTSAGTRFPTIAYCITGAADPAVDPPAVATTASGSSATPDPPSISPPSSKDYLFIAFAGMAGEEADDDTWGNTPPTNYTPSPPRQKSCGTVGTNLGGLILSAERQLTTGAAENPGTFGVDVSAAWRAQTIIVHPAPPPTQTGTAKLSLASGSTPSSRTAHRIKVRARVQSGTGRLRVALYEGATNRIGGVGYLEQALTTSLADYTLAIDDADAANIGSYSNLDLWVWGYAPGGGSIVFEVDQIWLEIPGAAGTTYSDTPAGGIVLGGATTTERAFSTTPAGGIVLGGVASSERTTSVTPAGGIVLGGVATGTIVLPPSTPAGGIVLGGACSSSVFRGYSDSPSGGIVLGGTATTSRDLAVAPAGGITLGGTAASTRISDTTPTGGITLGGTAASSRATAVSPGGGIVLGGSASSDLLFGYSDTPSGGIALAGSATSSATLASSPAGGITLNGSASSTLLIGYNDLPAGGIVLGGAASSSSSTSVFPAGGIILGGTAPSSLQGGYADFPAGGIRLDGAATSTRTVDVAPSGGITLAGASSSTRILAASPAGGIVLAGSATSTIALTFNVFPSGGIILGGRTGPIASTIVGFGVRARDGIAAGARARDGIEAGVRALAGVATGVRTAP